MNRNGIRIRLIDDQINGQFFKSIIFHPMETGRRRDLKTGNPIKADYIENVLISVDDETYFNIYLGANVSSNPYLAFKLAKPIYDGQKLKTVWTDNNNRRIEYQCVVQWKSDNRFDFIGNEHELNVKRLSLENKPVCQSKNN